MFFVLYPRTDCIHAISQYAMMLNIMTKHYDMDCDIYHGSTRVRTYIITLLL